MNLELSKDLKLPLEAVTQTIGILAKRGAGKTYTASVLAEEFVNAKLPFCVLDPTGAWWGLRVLADGKPGLSVIIIGGKHGDIPLEPTAGKLTADLIVDNPGFYVLDMSLFDSNANQDRFATDFAERLYRRKQSERDPLHLFVDEADSFAPQRPYRGQERMLGAFEALSRRGRLYGIGVTLISQRAAVINKNVLSQIEVLIALQTTSPHDRDAIQSWAEGQGTKKQVEELMSTLAGLNLGEAWIWSPSWLELFKRVQIRKRLTFNSSATPKVGEIRKEPKALAPVDIEKLRIKMAETIERVKSEDPVALRRQIAELKKHKCPVINQNPVKMQKIEVPVMGKRTLEGFAKAQNKFEKIAKNQNEFFQILMDWYEKKFLVDLQKITNLSFKANSPILTTNVSKMPISAPKLVFTAPQIESGDETPGQIGKGEKVILTAIAQYPEGITNPHIAILTGYKNTSRRTYLQKLKLRGFIESKGDMIFTTPLGIEELGESFEPLPTGEELRKQLLQTLPEGERRIFAVLVDIYPLTITREEIMERTAYKTTSVRTYIQKLNARHIIDSIGGTGSSGGIKVADKLFS